MVVKAAKNIPSFIKIPKIKTKPPKPDIKPPKPKSSGTKINETIKAAKPKKTKAKTTKPKTAATIQEGTPTKKTFMQRIPTTAKVVVPAVAGASIVPAFFRDGDEDKVKPDQDFTISNPITNDEMFESDTGGSIPDTNPSDWAEIMKARLVNDQGFELDQKGDFVNKPKFRNYLRSLPKAYMDKVSVDQDFAKKMMAGFLNMMKPVEGFVPVNPFVAFGEGYLGEESRQADMLPADVQTLKFLEQNPRLAKLYRENLQAEAGVLLSDVKAEDASGYYNLLIGDLARKQNVSIDQIASGNYELYYGDTPVGETFILGQIGKGVNVLADPNYSLKAVE
tara:strand:+ start:1112 stop:2119 length:1008 start_codon:yes stop_codon:yes gene_type:complete